MQQHAANQTEITRSALTRAAFECVAEVHDLGRATDLAITLSPGRLAVIRCSDHASRVDHTLLATMVAEGDFAWAGLVYSDQLGIGWPGLIEAFQLSELPRLIGRLKELQRAEAP